MPHLFFRAGKYSSFSLLFLFLLLLLLIVQEVDAWNIGETLPVSVHWRLKRDATIHEKLNTLNNDDDDDDDEERNNNNNNNIIQGQHSSTHSTRPLPPDFCPRFGINKRVHQPARHLFEYAKNATIKNKINSVQSISDVALKFQLERGLTKSTAWLPLLKRAPPNTREGNFTKDNNFIITSNNKNVHIIYLASINFNFGYQGGTFNKLTTFQAEPVYSLIQHDDIELRYHWEERRVYNPHRALSVCAFIAVITAIIVLHMMLLRGGRFAKQFRNKNIAVRNHKE